MHSNRSFAKEKANPPPSLPFKLQFKCPGWLGTTPLFSHFCAASTWHSLGLPELSEWIYKISFAASLCIRTYLWRGDLGSQACCVLESEFVPCVVCTVLCPVPARYWDSSKKAQEREPLLVSFSLEKDPRGAKGL